MNDQQFCDAAREIYRVIGRPRFHSHVGVPPDHFFEVWAALGRDYLREKLRDKMCFIQDEMYDGLQFIVKRMTQPMFFEYLRSDGLWARNTHDERCYFDTYYEALIAAARAVFMGGENDDN